MNYQGDMYYVVIESDRSKINYTYPLGIDEAYYWHFTLNEELNTYASNAYWLGIL